MASPQKAPDLKVARMVGVYAVVVLRKSLRRTKSPSCAIAMPRSARARAAAVISESIGIPSHL